MKNKADIPCCIYGPPEMMFRRRRRADEEMENRKHIEVAAAVLRDGHRILAAQRGYGNYKGWWEFPGGKVEPGESHEQTLHREIREEMDADIVVDSFLTTVEYDYPEFHLTMHCYCCHFAGDGFTLKEHLSARWLAPDQFDTVRWLPADEEPLRLLAHLLR